MYLPSGGGRMPSVFKSSQGICRLVFLGEIDNEQCYSKQKAAAVNNIATRDKYFCEYSTTSFFCILTNPKLHKNTVTFGYNVPSESFAYIIEIKKNIVNKDVDMQEAVLMMKIDKAKE